MEVSLINLFLAFLEGFALIISPCILPILPIILSASIAGGKRQSVGIIIGFICFFALFTFFARSLVLYTGINLNSLRIMAFILIILFGVVMISDRLSAMFEILTRKIGLLGEKLGGEKKTPGFWSGLWLGGLISLIWTPCAGPILAAVIVQIATAQTNAFSFLMLLSFAIGSVIPMLLIAFLGQKILGSLTFFKKHSRLLRKIFGVILIIATIIAAYTTSVSISMSKVTSKQTISLNKPGLINAESQFYPAPPLSNISAWINSPPLTIAKLKGKVILIDFWAYSCINCVRSLPYLIDWYNKYHDKGLIIIGVHTPEFEFEKNLENVKKAVVQYGIHYPVALDNQYSTWLGYNNRYWPAHYLINKNGDIVYIHFGEGEYDVTENNIRFLLGMTGAKPQQIEEKFSAFQTPETYLGYSRADSYAGLPAISNDKPQNYLFPDHLPQNKWALQGRWLVTTEKIIAKEKGAAIKIKFVASKVYAVIGSNKPTTVQISISNTDVKTRTIAISGHKLYEVASFNHPVKGEVTLTMNTSDVEIYTFTFG